MKEMLSRQILLNETTTILRSILISYQSLQVHNLMDKFTEIEGNPVPFEYFGYDSFEELLKSRNCFEFVGEHVSAKINQASKHIVNLTEQQKNVRHENKSSKKTGTVKWFNMCRGYGFIKCDDDTEDVFFHRKAIVSENANEAVKTTKNGEVVAFDMVASNRGYKATNITRKNGKPFRAPFIPDKKCEICRFPIRKGERHSICMPPYDHQSISSADPNIMAKQNIFA